MDSVPVFRDLEVIMSVLINLTHLYLIKNKLYTEVASNCVR